MDFYYQATDLIKKTESRGQDLMIDSFILGYMVGVQKLKNMNDLQKVVDNLHEIKVKIDSNQISPFSRDEYFIKKLASLFPEKQKKLNKKKDEKQSLQKDQEKSQFDAQSQYQQNEGVEESQDQNKIQKSDAKEQIQLDSMHEAGRSTKNKVKGVKNNSKQVKNQDEQKNETK